MGPADFIDAVIDVGRSRFIGHGLEVRVAVAHCDLVEFGSKHILVVGVITENNDIPGASAQEFQHPIDPGTFVVVLDDGVVRLEVDISQLLREGKALALLFCCRSIELIYDTKVCRIKIFVNDIGRGLAARTDLIIKCEVFS